MGEGEWSPRIFDRSESQQSACDGDKWCLLCIIILVVISWIRERASDLIRNREPGGGNQANATIDSKEAEDQKK